MKKSIFITATLLSIGLQGCLLPSLARPIELDNDCQNSGIGTKALESIYHSKRNAVVRLEVGGGIGTAFVVSGDGLALTAAHVVRGQQNIRGKFFDRSLHSVRVISLHTKLDLALVKLETRQPLSVLNFEPSTPKVGESVFSIGNSCNDFLAARFGKVLELWREPKTTPCLRILRLTCVCSTLRLAVTSHFTIMLDRSRLWCSRVN